MTQFFNILRYFFYPIPGSKFQFYIPLLVIAGLILLLAAAIKWKVKKDGRNDRAFKKLFEAKPYGLFWLAFLLLASLFGRYERFPLLGSRIVLYIICLASIYIIGKLGYLYFKRYPREREKFREAPSQKKYTIEKFSRH